VADSNQYFKATAASGKYYCSVNYGTSIGAWLVYFTYNSQYYGLTYTAASGSEPAKWGISSPYDTYLEALNNINQIPVKYFNEEAKDEDEQTRMMDLTFLSELIDLYFAGSNISASNIAVSMQVRYIDDVNVNIIDMSDENNKEVIDNEDPVSLTKLDNLTKLAKLTWHHNDISYTLSTNLSPQKAGQSIAYYKTQTGENIIVNAGKYNYINIPKDAYQYYGKKDQADDSGPDRQYDYCLYVTPVYVDNIYKVNLHDVNGFTLNDTRFTASVTDSVTDGSSESVEYKIYKYDAGWKNVSVDTQSFGAKSTYTYKETTLGYTAYSSGLIENYIANTFVDYIAGYCDGVANATLQSTYGRDIFNCLYNTTFEGGVIKAGSTNNLGQVTDSYIFLANNQLYNVPTFYRDGYELIAYENDKTYDGTKKYIYPTGEYDPTVHGDFFDDSVQTMADEDRDEEENNSGLIWCLDDDYLKGVPAQLNAVFYRKYYILNIQTLLNANLSNNGYVVIKIEDYHPTETGVYNGTYMVYYNQTRDAMELYNFGSRTTVNGFSLTKISGTSYKNKFVEKDGNMCLKLYSLCTLKLKVVDQSIDISAAMNDDDFIDMVGYKFDSIDSYRNFIDDYTNVGTEKALTHDDIEAYAEANNLDSNDEIDIDVNFKQIDYTLTMDLVNGNAGVFKVNNNAKAYKSTTISKDNMIIGYDFKFKYDAYSGFTLAPNAFTLGGNISLQNYDDANPEQEYEFTFNSMWLRELYYKNFDVNFTTDAVDLQAQINTDVLDFNFAVMLYDSTAVESSVEIVSDRITYNGITYYVYAGKLYEDNAHNNPVKFYYEISANEVIIYPNNIIHITEDKFAFKLDEDIIKGKNSTSGVTTLLTNVAGMEYVYDYSTDVKYAVLNAELFYKLLGPNTTTQTCGFLNKKQLKEFSIDCDDIAKMTGTTGTIIPAGERQLYIKLDVRKIMQISVTEVTTDVTFKQDPNVNRSTTIANGTNNSVKFTTTGSMYTYMGATNTIVPDFDSKYYTGVEYKLDGADFKESSFDTTGNHELNIKYIVKTLKANVKYYVDDVETADVSDYLQDIALLATRSGVSTDPEKLYIGDSIKYNATLKNQDYTLTVTINNSTYVLDSEYPVSVNDYNHTGINIKVMLVQLPTNEVRVKLSLKDNSQAVAGEAYLGSVDIFEDGNKKDSTTNSDNFEVAAIVSTRSLAFGFTLNEGYVYAGSCYFEKSHRAIDVDLVDGKLTITNNFSEGDSGIYYIYVRKSEVFANLTVPSQLQEGRINYTISSNQDSTVETSTEGTDKTLSLSLFVNAVVKFTADEANKEVLKYFYYVNKNGDIVYLTNDGTATGSPVLEYTLTSDILQTLEQDGGSYIIDFKAESTNKFKVEYSIIYGAENIRNNSFKVYVNYDASLPENVECENGGYYHSGTEINLFMETIETNKYLITILNRGDYSILNNEIFTLTDDLLLQIRIDPVQFGVDIAEGYYSNLTDLDNSTPLPETEHPVNNAVATGSNYKDPATLKLDYVSTAGDRVLYEITISKSVNYYVYDNKLYTNLNYSTEVDFAYTIDDDTVTIVGENYSITDGIIKVEQSATAKVVNNIVNIEGDSEVFSIYIDSIRNKVVISYTTTSVVNIQLNYADYKVISQFS